MRDMNTQEKRLEYLLDKFKEDSVRYKDLEVEQDYGSRRMALRSLMNIRLPKKLSREVLRVQDEFLTEEAEEKGIVGLSDMKTIREA